MLKPKFTTEISLGTVVQMVVGLIMVMGAVIALKGFFDDRFAQDEARIAAHELRLAIDERQIDKLTQNDDAFHTEMRTALTTVLAAIADLRVQVVQKEDLRRR